VRWIVFSQDDSDADDAHCLFKNPTAAAQGVLKALIIRRGERFTFDCDG
jgi:hypothetical protein